MDHNTLKDKTTEVYINTKKLKVLIGKEKIFKVEIHIINVENYRNREP